jgi:ParB/RepB/Spo0J family partition protein
LTLAFIFLLATNTLKANPSRLAFFACYRVFARVNSRDRNMKVFEEIVESIQLIGLKKPITVAERPGEDGQPTYVLVCGEGRLNAFRILGETHIPALVVDVSDEDAFIMSLAENIARRGYRPLEILADIELLRNRGYSADVIIQKTGLSPKYVRDIVFLLEQGEERLIARQAVHPRRHPHFAQHEVSPSGGGGGTDGEQQHHHRGPRRSTAQSYATGAAHRRQTRRAG